MVQILNKEQFNKVLSANTYLYEANKRKKQRVEALTKLLIFRLIVCCGLRPQEARKLVVSDLVVEGDRPHVQVRKEIAKGNKARRVPLWWDEGTLHDIARLKAHRVEHHGLKDDSLVLTGARGKTRQGLSTEDLWVRWGTLMKRGCGCPVDNYYKHKPWCTYALRPYDGRHTFASMSLHGGRSLVEVRDAMGHASIATTNIYLHIPFENKAPAVGNLFDYSEDED